MAGHQFGAGLILLFVNLVLKAATSQRAAAGVLRLMSPYLPGHAAGALRQCGPPVADAVGAFRTAAEERGGQGLGVDHGPHGAAWAAQVPGDRRR